MSQKRLLYDVEKLMKVSTQAIQSYDSRWQDLRELNVSVSEAEANLQATTDADRRPASKGKKNAVRAGSQELLDLKHARDSRNRIEWDLAALLRRLHRFRQSVVDWLSCSGLRHQHSELASLKKTLDLRYKRGRAFYSEGRCSDPAYDDNEDGMSRDIPAYHCSALLWIDAFISDLRKQRRLFRSEALRLQTSSSSTASSQPAPPRIKSKLTSKTVVETPSQSPPKTVPKHGSRRGRNTQQVIRLESRKETTPESEANSKSSDGGSGNDDYWLRMHSSERNERIGILEGLAHVHRLHISRLTRIRSGLLCQTLDAPSEILDQIRETLNPYVHNNSNGNLVLGEEIYDPLTSGDSLTAAESESSSSSSGSTDSCYSTSLLTSTASGIESDGDMTEQQQLGHSEHNDNEDMMSEHHNSKKAFSTASITMEDERIRGASRTATSSERSKRKGTKDRQKQQRKGSLCDESDETNQSYAATASGLSTRPRRKNEDGSFERAYSNHIYNERLTVASTEAESDGPSCCEEALTDEGSSSSSLMSPAPHCKSEGPSLLESLFNCSNNNQNSNESNNNNQNNNQNLVTPGLPTTTTTTTRAANDFSQVAAASWDPWDSSPWRHWDAPTWQGRPSSSSSPSAVKHRLLTGPASPADGAVTLSEPRVQNAEKRKSGYINVQQQAKQQQQYNYYHQAAGQSQHSDRNIWGPLDQIEWLSYREPVAVCKMHVNFDGKSVSKNSLQPATNKTSKYLNIQVGDFVDVLVRQPGGWAFGVIRQLNEDYSNQTTGRSGWLPEWLTRKPFSEPFAVVNRSTTKVSGSQFHPPFRYLRSPIISMEPKYSLPSSPYGKDEQGPESVLYPTSLCCSQQSRKHVEYNNNCSSISDNHRNNEFLYSDDRMHLYQDYNHHQDFLDVEDDGASFLTSLRSFFRSRWHQTARPYCPNSYNSQLVTSVDEQQQSLIIGALVDHIIQFSRLSK